MTDARVRHEIAKSFVDFGKQLKEAIAHVQSTTTLWQEGVICVDAEKLYSRRGKGKGQKGKGKTGGQQQQQWQAPQAGSWQGQQQQQQQKIYWYTDAGAEICYDFGFHSDCPRGDDCTRAHTCPICRNETCKGIKEAHPAEHAKILAGKGNKGKGKGGKGKGGKGAKGKGKGKGGGSGGGWW